MKCPNATDHIKAYIDGELGPVVRWRVERHIARCPRCREEMTAMAELTNKIKNIPQAHAPERLRQAVLGSIDFKPIQTAHRRWPYATSPVGAALILIITVVVAAALFPVFTRTRSSSTAMLAQSEKSVPQPGAAEPALTEAPATPASKVAMPSPKGAEPSASPMIIKTADLSVQVNDFGTAHDQAVSIAKSAGGYVTSSSAETAGSAPTSGALTVRVPGASFERAMQRLGKLGKVTSKSLSGDDVTGEVVDLEARLRNKRAEERQYLEIMNRAHRVPDIVTVTNELSRVRGEIEEAQGRMKYLRSAVSMSTINLTLSEKQKPGPAKSSIERSWGSAVGALVGAANRALSAVIWVAVFSPFWGLPLVGWAYVRRRSAVQRPQPQEPA